MSLERLKAARKKTIGTKQTAKAIERGLARVVFVARDADTAVTRDVVAAATARHLELVYVDTMAALGKACGIDVGAAAAAILEG
ncbi:ribosomal L7Ae/L30e/S12e/Gadd45 family protein [Caldinitratiruptor microaerophilus]|uniref:Ribosome-associated protein L7Ae-like n=1 Tax=Caldinitratiruptor microaerophilus TaxID=671077 RepID=A0AA35CP44_9FIRM|nr:ribosomal L7Ae/L30e/S12e/Gadd45 family protein [Caldinitratiruptor microaerophilus]BDG62214.1 ribosome-associated protein L7Ae-like [Caldinitratiruptor microaerophilus]